MAIPIAHNIDIVDLGLFLTEHNTLVLGDFHLGYEDSLHAKGVLVPRFALADISHRLDKILQSLPDFPSAIIINGDLKHEFGRITRQEWRDILSLIDWLKTRCKKLIIIKGNHDPSLGVILTKRGISLIDHLQLGTILIIHGDEIINCNKVNCNKAVTEFRTKKPISTVIIGHEHPAIGIKHGSRLERFKCFLKGNWKGKTLIAMPSFHLATEGTDMARERRISPYLKGTIDSFEVFVVADTVYSFGTIKKIRALK